MAKNISLSEQIVLITGASGGIGAALAEHLADNYSGIRIVLAARNQVKLAEVAANCRQKKADVLVIPTDMAQVDQIQSLAKNAVAYYGRVDALVNNAGYGQIGPIELIPPAAAKEQLAVNFHGPLILTQALIPIMRSQGGGKIINISSLGGRIPFPAAGMYSCSKFALEALSDVLRMELKAFKIQVSVIEPGPVITDFFRVAWARVKETMPNYAHTPYAPVFENIEAIDDQLDLLGWSSERTAKAIAKVMASHNPRPRYILATGGNVLVFLMNKIFPTWARDEFWQRSYGIHKIQFSNSQSGKEGKEAEEQA